MGELHSHRILNLQGNGALQARYLLHPDLVRLPIARAFRNAKNPTLSLKTLYIPARANGPAYAPFRACFTPAVALRKTPFE